MGDLNIDYMDATKRRFLHRFCANHNLTICDIGPTHTDKSFIDHVLLPELFPNTKLVTSFKNLYSDHKSISLRYLRNRNEYTNDTYDTDTDIDDKIDRVDTDTE